MYQIAIRQVGARNAVPKAQAEACAYSKSHIRPKVKEDPTFKGTKAALSTRPMGLFLPLILGEAAEYDIIILVRWQQDKFARVITLAGEYPRKKLSF